jgi:hypothetical protein
MQNPENRKARKGEERKGKERRDWGGAKKNVQAAKTMPGN